MRRTRRARNLEGNKLKHASGKGRWVQKEVKRLEQLATSRGDGKKKRTSKKQMMKYLYPGHALTAYYDTEKIKKKGSRMIENRSYTPCFTQDWWSQGYTS